MSLPVLLSHLVVVVVTAQPQGFPNPRAAVDSFLEGYIRLDSHRAAAAINQSTDPGREFAKTVAAEINLWKATKQMQVAAKRKFGDEGLRLIGKQRLMKYREDQFSKVKKEAEIYTRDGNPDEGLALLPYFARKFVHLEKTKDGWLISPRKEWISGLPLATDFAEKMTEKTRHVEKQVEAAKTLADLKRILKSDKPSGADPETGGSEQQGATR